MTRGKQLILVALFSLTVSAGTGTRACAADAGPASAPPTFLDKPLAYWTAQAAAQPRQEPAERIVQALTLAIQSQEPRLQVTAIDGLQTLGPDAKGAIDVLVQTLGTSYSWVGVAAMDVLTGLGHDAVPRLIAAFEHGSGAQRNRAFLVLGALGPEAQAAVPVLTAALDKETGATRDRLRSVLAAIRGEPKPPPVPAAPAAHPAALTASVAPLPAVGEIGDWPQFRGPLRDGICRETGLLTDWPAGGPPLLWKLEGLGRGYSSLSIAGGKLFTMGDRPEAAGQESQYALAYDLATRRELWATRVGPPNSDGGPRCTPTVADGRVYVEGTDGDVLCLEAETGRIVWQKSLPRDFGGQMMSTWKFSESPLVDGPRVIVTPGVPPASLVALDKGTGAVLWKSTLPGLGEQGNDGAGYSSPLVATIAGVRQYVQLVGRGLIGVEADTGRFLWGYNRVANKVANISTPLVCGDYVFTSTCYQTGSALLHITRDGDTLQAREVYFLDAKTFENHHGGVVLVGEYLYGGHGQNRGWPTCLKLATGEIAWKERPPAAGSAAVLFADGHLLFRYDRGPVALIEPTPAGYRRKAQFSPPTGDGPAWPHPVIHRGKLYLRHADLLTCYDLRP